MGFCEVEESRIDRDVVVASDEPAIVFVEMKLLPIVAGIEDPSCTLINFSARR